MFPDFEAPDTLLCDFQNPLCWKFFTRNIDPQHFLVEGTIATKCTRQRIFTFVENVPALEIIFPRGHNSFAESRWRFHRVLRYFYYVLHQVGNRLNHGDLKDEDSTKENDSRGWTQNNKLKALCITSVLSISVTKKSYFIWEVINDERLTGVYLLRNYCCDFLTHWFQFSLHL